MLLQAITIADRHYARARDEVDFIKRYIFPGCCIPSVGALTAAMVADERPAPRAPRGHRARTTRPRSPRGGATSTRHLDRVRALGYPDTFVRMWEFYLCYCEAGFAERALGDVQMLMTREG